MFSEDSNSKGKCRRKIASSPSSLLRPLPPFCSYSYTFDTTSASQDKVKVIEEYEGNKIIGGGELPFTALLFDSVVFSSY